MTVNIAVLEGTANSQHYMEISTDGGGTYTKVELMLDIGMPEDKKVTDDITPTDAHNTHKVAVDFVESNDIEFELVFNPSNQQHTALKTAYQNSTVIYSRILFEDERIEGYEFPGTISKFTPDPDPKKKLRYKGTMVISGDIDNSVTSSTV